MINDIVCKIRKIYNENRDILQSVGAIKGNNSGKQ